MPVTPRRVFLLFIGSVCVLGAGLSAAQDYPTRPIRLVVANTPGTQADTVARIVGTEMSKSLGQPVVVENKPGGNSIIGWEYVARQAPADGYTMVVGSLSALSSLPALVKDLRFDPLNDLPPFIGLVEGRSLLASSSQLPWKGFNEMVAYAKANPGKLNYGSPNVAVRLNTETIIQAFGINVVHVPYKATGPLIQGLVSSDIHMCIISLADVTSLGEKLRPLAVTGERRIASLPDVPTFAELGLPQMPGFGFLLHVRSGTPKSAVDRLHAAASRSLQHGDTKAQIAKLGLEIVADTPEVTARKLAELAKVYADIAKRVGIQPE